MSLIQLASGNSTGGGSGSFITGSITALADLALNLSIGNVSPSEIESFVNPAAYAAEAGQPEGAAIELDISGWTFLGTDYSGQVASQINSYWQSGEFVVNGEDMAAWPGASQVAYGGNDTVTLQYLKGQIWILYIAVAVALAYVAMQIFGYFTGQKWAVGVESSTTTTSQNFISRWWNNLPVWERVGLFVFTGLGLIAVAVVGSEIEIAKAGANKSNIVIEK
jgi:hypothetical protein